MTEPVLLIGGGSGMVPLMSMLRGRRAAAACWSPPATPTTCCSRASCERLDTEVIPTYTRWAPRGWTGYARRVDRAMLREVDLPGARVYVCGPTPFVESVANDLVALGHDPATIRTERFG